MRLITVYSTMLLLLLSFQSGMAAPAKKHNHNGRAHTHILPATGVKHFHKHEHNGRAHIHPYSAKVGFKHTHTRSQKSKAWANAVKHVHAGRPHTHPLPRSGIKHNHKHKHGSRSHIHPLPATGVKHYHQVNRRAPRTIKKAPMITGLSINQQIDAVLNRPIRKSPNTNKTNQTKRQTKPNTVIKRSQAQKPKTNTPVINGNTFKKVLAYGVHQHNGRSHQHNLPKAGKNHTHKNLNVKKSKPKTVVKNKSRKQNIAKKKIVHKKTVKAKQRPKTAIKVYKAKSKQTPEQIAAGNRQFALALRYENGTGVKKNLPQAVNWYLRAAKQGNAKAQFNLASLYENGEGVARNIPQALRWYTTAAHNGDVNAQVNLGNQYARGTNVAKDINEATKWYKRASDQGDMRGRANLNYLIEDNNGVIRR